MKTCPNCGWEFESECSRCQYFPDPQPMRDFKAGMCLLVVFCAVIAIAIAYHWIRYGSPYG